MRRRLAKKLPLLQHQVDSLLLRQKELLQLQSQLEHRQSEMTASLQYRRNLSPPMQLPHPPSLSPPSTTPEDFEK